jgi:prepilin-type N-terminal cleavage/methylation domain-containing protein
MKTLSPSAGFSLPELLVGVAVAGIATTVMLTSYVNQRRDAQLRQAALELAGYLETAKGTARGAKDPCQLTIVSATAVIGPSTTSPNSCAGRPSMNLNQEAGADGITASGSILITFTARAFVSSQTITYLSMPNSSFQACVLVNSPVGLIRKGYRPATSSGDCNYVGWY